MTRIITHEFKKAVASPIVIGLTTLFIAFNLYLIYDHSSIRSELAFINQLIDNYGYKMNESTISSLSGDYHSGLEKLNMLTNDKLHKTYKSAEEFFSDFSIDKELLFSKKELLYASDVLLLEIYHNELQKFDSQYSKLDLKKSAEEEIKNYHLSGEAAETVRENFQLLEGRKEELLRNGEHKTLFFSGKTFNLHTFLFRVLLHAVIIQSMILSVLMTGFIHTYEFENKTHLTAYSSKRGRNLIFDKLIASIGASMFMTTIILFVTLACYFLVFDYSRVWNVPISSYFNAEFKFPYISWWELSFGQYFALYLLILYICQLLFTKIAFVISAFFRNSYLVFVVFILLWGVGVLVPGLIQGDSNMLFTTRLTPFTLISNPHLWFIGWGAFQLKYYEITTIVIWFFLLSVMTSVSIIKFKRQNIH
jgi:hypothetical protein